MNEPVKVAFRIDDGEVIAVFADGSCYAHVGQHSTYSGAWLRKTCPALPREYADLKRELESAPYHYQLDVVRRVPRAWFRHV